MLNYRIDRIAQLHVGRPPDLIRRNLRVTYHLHSYVQPPVRCPDSVQGHRGRTIHLGGEVCAQDESEAIGGLEDGVIRVVCVHEIVVKLKTNRERASVHSKPSRLTGRRAYRKVSLCFALGRGGSSTKRYAPPCL